MGDERRFIVFAEWIEKQFSLYRHKNVADIAGGQGTLSIWLKRIGYNTTLYELRKKTNKKVKKIKQDVSTLHFEPYQYNLIVGLHPDKATWHIIRLAKESKCPFAIVPCCVEPPKGKKPYKNWMKWLNYEAHSMGFNTYVTQLNFRGKNEVLKGWL